MAFFKKIKKQDIELPSKEESEAQLSIDVYETEDDLVIQSTIAGVQVEDVNIIIENGSVIIRGNRKKIDEDKEKKYLYQECYWGSFFRQLILPSEIEQSKISAKMKDGVLIIRIPKIKKNKIKKIEIEQEK